MTKADIYNWLIMAFSEPLNDLTEAFYYDHRDREFFSIHFMDYILLNDDLTVNESVESSYSDGIRNLIVDRIGRLDNEDNSIVAIPRLKIEKRKAIMNEFINTINDGILLNILTQRIKNIDGSQRFNFYFGSEVSDDIKEEWELFKRTRLMPEIAQFIGDNKIELEKSRLWDIGNDFSIKLQTGL